MRLWKRTRTTESDARFDTRILESRASFIEHYNATFDFEAGLDEVYARARLARPNVARLPPQAPALRMAGRPRRRSMRLHLRTRARLPAAVDPRAASYMRGPWLSSGGT